MAIETESACAHQVDHIHTDPQAQAVDTQAHEVALAVPQIVVAQDELEDHSQADEEDHVLVVGPVVEEPACEEAYRPGVTLDYLMHEVQRGVRGKC